MSKLSEKEETKLEQQIRESQRRYIIYLADKIEKIPYPVCIFRPCLTAYFKNGAEAADALRKVHDWGLLEVVSWGVLECHQFYKPYCDGCNRCGIWSD